MIRSAQIRDAAFLEQLVNDYIAPFYNNTGNLADCWINSSNFKNCFVYEANNNIMGLVCVSDKPYKEYIKISTLIVVKEHQGKGVGSELLNKAFEYFNNSAKNEISITLNEDFKKEHKFFESKGFKLKYELKDKYIIGKSEYVFVKKK